ncbi:MAG: hypothetical protein U9N40_05355 [Euryarchaeota archaeon]|nr:hypothetical protein [Euryarchaeota archaeon]
MSSESAVENAACGPGVVDRFADYLQRTQPDLKGFNRRGLYRMKQLPEISRGNADVSAVMTQYHPDIASAFRDTSTPDFLNLPHENPGVGVILCKSMDAEVVEYTHSRNLSSGMIAEYRTKLIGKEILQQKLHELFLLSAGSVDEEGFE